MDILHPVLNTKLLERLADKLWPIVLDNSVQNFELTYNVSLHKLL